MTVRPEKQMVSLFVSVIMAAAQVIMTVPLRTALQPSVVVVFPENAN